MSSKTEIHTNSETKNLLLISYLKYNMEIILLIIAAPFLLLIGAILIIFATPILICIAIFEAIMC